MALRRHQKFSRLSGHSPQRVLAVLEGRVFPTIARGFAQLLEKLLQDDLRTLNVDVMVLEQMLELEGLLAEGAARQVALAADTGVASITEEKEHVS
jgi:NAD-dependent oxidoreductase involved in siderophore biosynthesis